MNGHGPCVDSIRTICQNVCMERTARVKKTYNLPPALVTRVQRILGARTETEAILRCLEEVAFMDEVERAVRQTSGRLPAYRPLR